MVVMIVMDGCGGCGMMLIMFELWWGSYDGGGMVVGIMVVVMVGNGGDY